MLKRTLDAAFLNQIANMPEVRPWLGGEGALDLTAPIANIANVTLVNEYGGFVGMKLESGLYECHSIFSPEGHGANAVEATREGLRYLFVATDCIEVVTKVPSNNPGALGLARAAGFSKQFEREKAWPLENGELVGVDYFSLAFAKWRSRDNLVLDKGVWFHTRLEELTTALAKPIPVHEDDSAHNRAVGASVLMLEAGNALKACGLYNRWAVFAGYPQIKLVSMNPIIIDMHEVVIAVQNGDMEVLQCR